MICTFFKCANCSGQTKKPEYLYSGFRLNDLGFNRVRDSIFYIMPPILDLDGCFYWEWYYLSELVLICTVAVDGNLVTAKNQNSCSTVAKLKYVASDPLWYCVFAPSDACVQVFAGDAHRPASFRLPPRWCEKNLQDAEQSDRPAEPPITYQDIRTAAAIRLHQWAT